MSKKCVVILDKNLPLGILANTAAILGITIGHLAPEIIGPTITDASGTVHEGITNLPIPILAGDTPLLQTIRARIVQAKEHTDQELLYVDFSDIAQHSNVYDSYQETEAKTPAEAQNYLGLAIYGDAHAVNKLTGSLPLLR